jgi:hypothetical protein
MDELAPLMESVAIRLLGDPNRRLSTKTEWRYGSRGSLAVDLKKGAWFDHEAGQGGGVLDLIEMKTGAHDAERFHWLEQQGLWANSKPNGRDRTRGLGLEVAHYDYVDEAGDLLFQVVRYDPKDFRQRRPDGKGGWIWNIKGVRQVPYRLPEIIEAIASDQLVAIVEGEKDADNLWQIGIAATTNAGGAGAWKDSINSHFIGADVVVLNHNDPAGRKHADGVAAKLLGFAMRVRRLDLAQHWRDMPDKNDVSDWLAQGFGGREELDELIASAPVYEAKSEQSNDPPIPADDLFDPWGRYIVPAFPIDVLPSTIRHFVAVQSDLIGCDRGALAMTALTAVSGALDHRFALKMLRNGDWWVSPRLWVLLVGDPSVKKTPIIKAATDELDCLQAEAFRKHKNDKAEYVAGGGDPDKFKPPPPRLTVNDVTIEKLGIILADQARGVLVKRDEIAGWIGAMEKYASGGRGSMADRAFWLKAYDGGPYSVDRVSRADLQIENLSASIIGGIQPARLAEIHGLTSDGLLQRFLPVLVSSSTFPRDVASSMYADRYAQLLRSLVELPAQKLFLAEDAVKPMEDLRQHLFDLGQNVSGIAEGFQTFIGKLEGTVGSLALILTLAGEATSRIPASVVDDVAELVGEFILPHAFEFYRGKGSGDQLRTLASWILTSGKTKILPSDLTTNVWDFRGLGIWDVNQRVSPLIAGGWLVPDHPGPMARAWVVNPQVAKQFTARARDEERRKAEIAALMKSPRKPAKA